MRTGEQVRANPHDVSVSANPSRTGEEENVVSVYDGLGWCRGLGKLVAVGECTDDIAEM